MQDRDYMALALDLAREGTALASPNPRVGAVVVQPGAANDGIVGRGVHRDAERAHAEVVALAEAGAAARGATLYLNLEPCSHTGRTPPCTEAILAAGIRRLVAAMSDPNPLVAGSGLERLRQAGVQVDLGLLEDEARALNADFAHWIRTRRPWVTLKAALSLDGGIAAANQAGTGSTTWISSEASRQRVQDIRHAHDAILVGIGTVLADDSRLTDRTGRPRRRTLLRAVVDAHLRLPLESFLVRSANADVVVFGLPGAPERRAALEAAGVLVVETPADSAGRVSLEAVLQHLGAAEITSLLVEGGSRVNAAMLAGDWVDRLMLFYAPVLLGDAAVPLVQGFTGSLPPPIDVSAETIADDVLVQMTLHDPYR